MLDNFWDILIQIGAPCLKVGIFCSFFSFRILEVGETIPYPVMKTKFEFLDKDVKPAAPMLSQPQVSFPAKH